MIRRISANQASFRPIEFSPGLNIVLADRTETSTGKDSRNGLGKTTLIEIIHYCLGSTTRKDQALQSSDLKDWAFTAELEVAGGRVKVTRTVEDPKRVLLEGVKPVGSIRPKTDADSGMNVLSIEPWTRWLGHHCFGLSPEPAEQKYAPTFRSLIAYFIRTGLGAFLTPFKVFPQQKTQQTQTENTFLLGLNWEDARDWQLIRDKSASFKALKQAQKHGALGGDGKSVGELTAARVRLDAQAKRVSESLSSFKVHEQYKEVEAAANALTGRIHELVAANVGDTRLIELYTATLSNERIPDSAEVVRMYENARVALPGAALKRLEDVQAFHEQVVANRRSFLGAEVERLKGAVAERDAQVSALNGERAGHMSVLRTHGALEEFAKLQGQHTALVRQIQQLDARIELLTKAKEGESALKIELEQLAHRARADYDERRPVLARAISLFNDYSQELYELPGDLIVDIGANGYDFRVEIPRAGSKGVEQMKIFCYDLALATLWSERSPSPQVLVHDSSLFADVDERQIATAIQVAARVAAKHGFTYICALNSDKVPRALFEATFNFDSFVRIRLTDSSDSGRLLGRRFERTVTEEQDESPQEGEEA